MRCAAAGSSQLPNASTRSGTPPATTMPVSPRISGFVGTRRPVHQHLRLRQQQRLEAVDLGVHRDDVVARAGLDPVGSLARAHQHDDGEHRKAEQCERQREWQFRPAERGDGAVNGVDDAGRQPIVGASRRAERDAKICDDEGGEESAPPRTRTQPLVRRPDRLRHSGLPQGCERRPPHRPRIAGLYPRGESRRKSPDRERTPQGAAQRVY